MNYNKINAVLASALEDGEEQFPVFMHLNSLIPDKENYPYEVRSFDYTPPVNYFTIVLNRIQVEDLSEKEWVKRIIMFRPSSLVVKGDK